MVWKDSPDGRTGIFARASTDGGETWPTSPIRLSGSDFTETWIGYAGSIALCGEGPRLSVAWAEYRDGRGRVFFQRSLDGGVSWAREERELSTHEDTTAVRIDSCGSHLVVVWVSIRWPEGESGADTDVRYSVSLDAGESWTAGERLDRAPAGATSDEPQISLSPVGLYVVRQDRRLGTSNIFFNGAVFPETSETESPCVVPHGYVKK